LFTFIKTHCESNLGSKNPYYAFQQVFALKYSKQITFNSHQVRLENAVKTWTESMRPPSGVVETGAVIAHYEDKMHLTALIMSVDEDEVLRQICLIHGAHSKDIKVLDLIQTLRTTCLKREEADRQTNSLGSADGPAARSQTAAAASSETKQRRCLYCDEDDHITCQCRKLIFDHLDGKVRSGFTVPKNLMKIETLLAKTNTDNNRDGRGRESSNSRGKSQGRTSSVQFPSHRKRTRFDRSQSRSRSRDRDDPRGRREQRRRSRHRRTRDRSSSPEYSPVDEHPGFDPFYDDQDDQDDAGGHWGGKSGTRYEGTPQRSRSQHTSRTRDSHRTSSSYRQRDDGYSGDISAHAHVGVTLPEKQPAQQPAGQRGSSAFVPRLVCRFSPTMHDYVLHTLVGRVGEKDAQGRVKMSTVHNALTNSTDLSKDKWIVDSGCTISTTF
jgi:hypothetical protein